jgi:hypothetical protein
VHRFNPYRSGGLKRTAVAAGAAVVLAAGSATAATAQRASDGDRLVCMNRQGPAAINNSFVSPITERFGDIRVGRGVFVASNTILRADPGRRVCIGSRTNTQDNVLVMALRDRRGVRGACARRPTSGSARASPIRPS